MSTRRRKTQYLIVGAGTAGLGARRVIAGVTDNYLVADPGPFGTTCARVGCMPSKLLIAAAERAHHAEEGEAFGVTAHGRSIDGPAVMRRVQSERDRFVGFVVESMGEWTAKHLLKHRARFIEPMVMQVGDEIIEAERIVLAVGSSPFIPPPFREHRSYLDTSDTIFEKPDLPSSVAVIGVGVIGLELGQAMHRLGVRTRMFGRGGVVGGAQDPEVLNSIHNIFGAELAMHPCVELPCLLEPRGDEILMRWHEIGGSQKEDHFERILLATGRRPNVDSLGLETAGIEVDEGGIPVFDPETLQCGRLPVFMAGDVLNERPLLHEASDEGRIAGRSAVDFPRSVAGHRRVPLSIVFSDPNIIAVGQRHDELDLLHHHRVGTVSFEDQGRSRVMGLNRGILRIYGEAATGKLVGAEGVGPRQEHISHLLAWAIGADFTVHDALGMPFYHPVIEEGVRTALRDLKKNCLRDDDPETPAERAHMS